MFRNLFKFNCVTVCKPYLYCNVTLRTNSKLLPEPKTSDYIVQKISSLLSGYGFKPGQINRILKSPHSILGVKEDELLSNLTHWLKFGVSEKHLTVFCAYPELLTLNPDFIDSRVKELMTLFTKKDISKLLVTCPTVFLDDFANVYEKIEYMVHMMGAEQKSIVKTNAMQFDLFYIKCRHMFITRSGHFIVNKKAVRFNNAPLDKILSKNMNKFLKITNLTEEEFVVFCRCFKEENLELQEDEESDDEQ